MPTSDDRPSFTKDSNIKGFKELETCCLQLFLQRWYIWKIQTQFLTELLHTQWYEKVRLSNWIRTSVLTLTWLHFTRQIYEIWDVHLRSCNFVASLSQYTRYKMKLRLDAVITTNFAYKSEIQQYMHLNHKN